MVADQLVIEGATALLSFGLAGGLDPAFRPGMLVVPRAVFISTLESTGLGESFPRKRESSGRVDPRFRGGGDDDSGAPGTVIGDGVSLPADPAMVDALGGATSELILGTADVVADAETKRRLWEQTGASAVDTESGAVARVARRHGLPFAVLRAVCDPAERSLPPAALVALDRAGGIRILNVLASVAAAPSQIPALIQLARDAAIARRALIRRVAELRDRFSRM